MHAANAEHNNSDKFYSMRNSISCQHQLIPSPGQGEGQGGGRALHHSERLNPHPSLPPSKGSKWARNLKYLWLDFIAHPRAGGHAVELICRFELGEDPFLTLPAVVQGEFLAGAKALVGQDDFELVTVFVRDEEVEWHGLLTTGARGLVLAGILKNKKNQM